MDSFSYPIFFVILQCVIKTLNLTHIAAAFGEKLKDS